MVGTAGLTGGAFGMIGGLSMLRRKQFLNISTLRHPIKRSELITNIVTNVRNSSAQFSSFGKQHNFFFLEIFYRDSIFYMENLFISFKHS